MSGLTLSKPDTFVADAGTDELHAAAGFGVRENRTAYFNPDSAAVGEAAWLRLTPTGRLFLEQDQPALAFGLEEGARRPVAILDPVTLVVRRKAGTRAARLVMRAPELTAGRPVALLDPQTLTQPARVRAPVEIPSGCRRCGAPRIQDRRMCTACVDQADARTVTRLHARSLSTAEIADESGLPELQVKYLLAKAARSRRAERMR